MIPATWGWIGRANVRVIPLRGGEIALVSGEDYERASAFRWHLLSKNNRYAASWLKTEEGRERILLHQLIMEPPPPLVVDHINWDGLDCRRVNMRVVTSRENNLNRRRQGYLGGVSRESATGRWLVSFLVAGRKRHFGRYRTREEAERAADETAEELGTPRLARRAEAIPIVNCPECGLAFDVARKNHPFCSRRCARKRETRENRAGALPPRKCAECEAEFGPRDPRQKYCGPECRRRVGNRKWAAFGAAWREANGGRKATNGDGDGEAA